MEPADSAWNLQRAVSDVCLCEGLDTPKLGVLQLFLCFLFHWQQVPRSPALWPRRRGAWQENKDCVAEFCGLTLLQCFTLFLGFSSSTVCGCHAATCSDTCSSACGYHTTIWSSMPEVATARPARSRPDCPLPAPPDCPQPACPHTSTKPHQQQPFFATVALQPCFSCAATASHVVGPHNCFGAVTLASSTAVFVFGLSCFRSRVHYSYKRN